MIAHVINHTHWDREWFLTSVYTSRWLPRLIDNLERRVTENSEYKFWLDGQTLTIEDLLAIAPSYADRVKKLIADRHLVIGPYYCQPDWQLTRDEALIRNLMLGQEDVQRLGGSAETGWLVDTFGHISQSPQIHQLFGIDSVYVWRGVPQLEPYFHWQSTDGSQLLAINLFGGYRNLYGVTHAPEVAVRRLQAEVGKLRPFYPTPDIPLFDGYDLEDDPEDPLTFYAQANELGPDITLREATPQTFARHIHRQQLPLPTIEGELNSGKYGATFPGTFSARTYLKVMARDCQHMLYQLCEPLAAMAHLMGAPYSATRYEKWSRLLLQNAVHDCICGVSIDQVHEKMEHSYGQLYGDMKADVRASLGAILADFGPGEYAVSLNPFAAESWQSVNGQLVYTRTAGIGLWPVGERIRAEAINKPIKSFSWRNEHYEASLDAYGQIRIGDGTFGTLVVSAEQGDTYSDELGESLGVLRPVTPLTVVERSEHHAVVGFVGEWQSEKATVSATVRLHFDLSPQLRWQIDLDSGGTDLRVEMLFETATPGDAYAGMPFDVMQRAPVDGDLLPAELPADLRDVLLGQRELGETSTFPFHDFVAMSGPETTVAVMAKGIHSYTASADGTIALTLRRAVEWLTKSDLQSRIGDAGPFFYVPDGRCERAVRHEVALVIGQFAADSLIMQRFNAAFQNPPLIVRGKGHGRRRSWQLWQEDLPLSSLHVRNNSLLARVYNPTSQPVRFSRSYALTDVWGRGEEEQEAVPAKKIVTVRLSSAPAEEKQIVDGLQSLSLPLWRIGKNQALPDRAILDQLERRIAALETELRQIESQVAKSHAAERLRLQHQCYVLEREGLELQLSISLNERKLAEQGALSYEYLYKHDSEIASIGFDLNRMRAKRRIFDYVVNVL